MGAMTVKGIILENGYIDLDGARVGEGGEFTLEINADGLINITDPEPAETPTANAETTAETPPHPGPAIRPERRFKMSCCDDPKPRILERTGRIFCANCKRYLDRPLVDSNEARAEREKEDDHENDGDVPGDAGAR